ncbi:hypothetical protein KKB44_06230 [Candidatus Micrarchaeota archaeon]|nr:hypothetical protein [Candidatus Micrarchaeota archaeon]
MARGKQVELLPPGRESPRTSRREPLAEAIQKRPHGFFTKMSDKELVGYAKRIIEEKKISGRKELQEVDGSLYNVLLKRNLLDTFGFGRKKEGRNWKAMTDEEIVRYAKTFMREREITGRAEVYRADKALYEVLRRRKLLDEVGFEEKQRDWSSMSDEEIVRYVRKFIEESGITRPRELQDTNSWLYGVLWRRGLLRSINFDRKRVDWSSMSDEEIIDHARMVIREREITGRAQLSKEISGLYHALNKRKLLDQVFADIEQSRRKEAILQVVEAMEEFAC